MPDAVLPVLEDPLPVVEPVPLAVDPVPLVEPEPDAVPDVPVALVPDAPEAVEPLGLVLIEEDAAALSSVPVTSILWPTWPFSLSSSETTRRYVVAARLEADMPLGEVALEVLDGVLVLALPLPVCVEPLVVPAVEPVELVPEVEPVDEVEPDVP